MIISRRELAKSKIKEVKNGFSAFAETQELIDLIKKGLEEENIPVHIDKTEQGSWFIPVKKENDNRNE